jgi:hypothetical protein
MMVFGLLTLCDETTGGILKLFEINSYMVKHNCH